MLWHLSAHILKRRYNFGVVEHPSVFGDISGVLEHRWVVAGSEWLLSKRCSGSGASTGGFNDRAIAEAIPDEWDGSAWPGFDVRGLVVDGGPLVGGAIGELVWVIAAVPFGVVKGDFVDTGELRPCEFFE